MDYLEHDLEKVMCLQAGKETDSKKVLTDYHQLKQILYTLLCALNFLHTANVVHRDLKPANILLNDLEKCRVVLCDFGLARTLSKEMTALSNVVFPSMMVAKSFEESKRINRFQRKKIASIMTSCRQMRRTIYRQLSPHVTTRWYRAPEIILTEPIYGTKVDNWSAGCIFAESLNYLHQKQSATKKADMPLSRKSIVLFPGSSNYPFSPCMKLPQGLDEAGESQ